MKQFFSDKDSDELIVFFCGWGMDERPFSLFQTNKDVLFLYDYENADINFDFSKYSKKYLIAFSYGVFMSALCNLPDFDLKIAINGTLKPIDKTYGIPPKIFELTLNNMTLETAVKFRRSLFRNEEDFQNFNKNLPVRSLESSLNELDCIKKAAFSNQNLTTGFDKIIVSKFDKIFPTKNQLNFWGENENIVQINAGHFLFYNFKSFEDIINIDYK
ncbi:MAG: DUF452 family protein [Candidatus Gastranaerophilales bacterium]|nr:DUF452 family protein [Candidatus Gastranaerophilales bacterium]